MATLKDFRDERLRKLKVLKDMGINPYPSKSSRTHNASDIKSQFEDLQGKVATVAGRVVGIRKFGKLAFIVIRDFSGQIQLFLQSDIVAGLDVSNSQIGIAELPLLDSGDFIEATGKVIKSKTDEISIEVTNLRILTKSLRPMPSAIDGFTNKEERLRRRYIDINTNQSVRDRFIRRSKFWQATRDFLNQSNFMKLMFRS